MRTLLRYFTLRYLWSHKLRAFLGISAIALGVALFISSDIATNSVVASVERTMRDLAGKAEWQVSRGQSLGVEQELVKEIRKIPGAIAAPIIQASATLVEPHAGTLLIFGIDFLDDSLLRLYKIRGQVDPKAILATAFVPDGIIITNRFSVKHRFGVGSTVKVDTKEGMRELKVTGILEDEGPGRVFGGNFSLMSLGSAQGLFGQPGRVSRIEVAGATKEQIEKACPGYSVERLVKSSSTMEDALARIKSLVIVSVIALLVGLFIIYNSVSISVVERMKEIGTMRALGATRRQIMSILLAEWFIVGFVGSVIGVVLGYFLASALIDFTARTVNAIVLLVDVGEAVLAPFAAIGGVILGVTATVVAAFIPARGAVKASPIEILRQHSYRREKTWLSAFWLGIFTIVIGCLLVSAIRVNTSAGIPATILIFLGVALMLPHITMQLARWTRPLLRRLFKVEGYLAADNVSKFPQRTALTVIALGGALSMMVATAALVEGFRDSANRWMKDALPFDLTVSANDFSKAIYSQSSVPSSFVDDVRKVEGVDIVYGVRSVFADFRGADILLVALEFDRFLEMHRKKGLKKWVQELSDPGLVKSFFSGEGIMISDNMAYLFDLKVGEQIELKTPTGPRKLRILGSIEEYSWPRGAILMDLKVYQELWKDRTVTYVDMSLKPGASRTATKALLSEKLKGRYSLFVYDADDLRRVSEDALQQTVALANIQVIIAILIGFLGILNTLLISVLRRTREIGLLRAVGMTRVQVARTVVIEAVFIGLVGGLVGVVGGLAGGWLPLRVFTLAITGYLTPIVVPWAHVIIAVAVAVLIGLVASFVPARRSARLNVLEAIGYE